MHYLVAISALVLRMQQLDCFLGGCSSRNLVACVESPPLLSADLRLPC